MPHRAGTGQPLPRGSLMSGKNTGRICWNRDSMIDSARSLQRVANELDKNDAGREAESSDEQLVEGIFLARPILLSLATEIALKAWQCSERKEPPDRIHDLLKLFESLRQDTQEMLEARMRKVSPFSVCAGDPRLQGLSPDFQDMFAARMHPLRYLFSEHREANVRWRFLYEKRSEKFETSEIDRALTVIIGAYEERRWS